jgi:hypothetical protein
LGHGVRVSNDDTFIKGVLNGLLHGNGNAIDIGGNVDIVKYLVLLFCTGAAYAGTWSSQYVTGSAPATYEYAAGNTTHYVNLTNGDHVAYRMQSTAVGTPIKPGASYGLASNGTVAKISSVLKMPLQNTKTLAVNLLAGVTKANLASAAIAAKRLAPAAIMTGVATWMIGAGLDYVAGQFTESTPVEQTTYAAGFGPWCNGINAFRSSFTACGSGIAYAVRTATGSPFDSYTTYRANGTVYSPGNRFYHTVNGVSACTGGSVYTSDGKCTGSGQPAPRTDDQAAAKLAATPQTTSGDTTASNDQIIQDTATNGAAPLPSSPVLSGPTAPIEIDRQQTVNSNGTRTEQIKTVTPVYNNDNSVRTTQSTTTNNYDSSNVLTSSSTVTTAQPEPSVADNQTDCDKYPDTIGCSQYGDVPAKDVIPTSTIDIALNYNSVAGSCPANVSLPRGLTWDMSTVCPYVQQMRPPIIITSLLAGAFIIIGAIKT